MDFQYFPGCTLKNKAVRLDRCARVSAEALGFTLHELPEWQCCGAVYPMARDELATRLSAVRALAAAAEAGQPLVTLCSACHHVIKRVNRDIQTDPELCERINRYLALPAPYTGQTQVLHYLEVLRDCVGFDRLAGRVAKPLSEKRLAPYYGCMLLRPSREMQLDDPENPRILEDFLRLGKIESLFVSVAVNNQPRTIDLLHMTYAQQSIIGSGGYMPQDVRDVQDIMASGRWDLESIITHEFALNELEQAIRTATDVDHAGNVVIKMAK